ncbi:ABC transporter permease [Pseudooceanicola algae]|uniref:Inner membrane ABC transporter permease protein YdcV n=1 Tax=Pseudooceanicola algae TaxID=1537215 RepID=A0A418SHM5_9RHOB|nr:ABC transporter permease [Pseudooceanicola algae]QPM90288.1 Inner membrane ABC transporter permease protein YdcV [Pseudooceanicola algae]
MTRYRPGPVTAVLGALVSVFLLLPLLAVVPVSFTPKRYLSVPQGEWSLRHYESLLTNSDWLESALLSLQVGLAAAGLATLLALSFTLGLWMNRPRFGGMLAGIALLPMVAPPVVSALTLYYFLRKVTEWNSLIVYDGWLGVAVAHAVMVVPYGVVILMVALSQLDRRIDLAAQSMGAGTWTRIRHVILPNIRFGIAGAFLLSFVLSWDEIGVTLFITSVRAVTLPRRMWMQLRDNIDPAVASVSVLLIGVVTLAILGRALLQYRKDKTE